MSSRKERRSGWLFSNSTKWLLFLLGAALMGVHWSPVSREPSKLSLASRTAPGKPPVEAQKEGKASVHENLKKEIEELFTLLSQNPEAEVKDRALRRLRRVLQESFAGQEDCWSCEGVVYFDRYDQIAGAGESRKPIGFREWLQDGDEAYEERRTDDARKFYSEALQILDERSLEEDSPLAPHLIEKLRSRCLELGCR